MQKKKSNCTSTYMDILNLDEDNTVILLLETKINLIQSFFFFFSLNEIQFEKTER